MNDAAREAYERGASTSEAARIAGVSHTTIRRWANRDGWQRNDDAAAARADAYQTQTVAARTAATVAWSERTRAEADAAGVYAGIARQAVRRALDDGDHQMVRAAAVAYGIFIDKAQLLSGGATARTEIPTATRVHELIDELAARRNAMRAA